MKVNIDKTLQVSDEQRKDIAAYIDGPGAKRREATREEMKDFIWNHGASWEADLVAFGPDAASASAPVGEDSTEDDGEDLIGGGDDLESLI